MKSLILFRTVVLLLQWWVDCLNIEASNAEQSY
jgi:hypothetical protein